MEQRIEEYTIGELAQAAGVSVRTLHHYDAIGLLKPAIVAANGYRLYRRPEALRLQEILFYRATGMPLQAIAELLDCGAPLARLLAHRKKLSQQMTAHAAMIATLDRTISHLNGETPMMIEELYKPFSPQKQATYESWLIETYGPEMAAQIEQSRTRSAAAPAKEHAHKMQKLRSIEADLVAAYIGGTPPEQAEMSAHQNWVAECWGRPCDAQAYRQLSELYLAHPDFIARFETLSQEFSQWLSAAMVAWSERP